MNQTVLGLIVGLIGGIAILLFSKKSSNTDAQILDLTQKIRDNQTKEIAAKADADAKTKEFQDALKKYDPDFHNDDGGGKPSA